MRVKNNSSSTEIFAGKEFTPGEEYDVAALEVDRFRSDDNLILKVSQGTALVGDGVSYKLTPAESLEFLYGIDSSPKDSSGVPFYTPSPFASKSIGGKKFFKRIHGTLKPLVTGGNTIVLSVGYPWVKMNRLEIMGGEIGDTASLYVTDTTTGTYSGVPDKILNQFGFDVCISEKFYQQWSEFDSDLYGGMRILIEYNSISAKTVGINFVLTEVK